MSIQIWFPLLASQRHYPCQYNFGQSLCKCCAEICQSHSHSFMGLPLNSSMISVKKKRSCRFLHEFKIQDTALLGRSSLKLLTHWVLTAVYDPAMPAAQDLIQSPPNAVEIFFPSGNHLLLSTAPGPGWLLTSTKLRTRRAWPSHQVGRSSWGCRMEACAW